MTEPIDSGTLWELHLAVARNDRARGNEAAAARSMRSARAHALARKLAKKLAMPPRPTGGTPDRSGRIEES